MLDTVSEMINSLLWGRIIPIFMVGIGVFLTICFGFFQMRKFPQMITMTLGRLFVKNESDTEKSLTTWQSVSTALASTIGTGSIVGIAVAIKQGGPGTLFWMWISAFLGMIIKYTEIVLSVSFRVKNQNGFYVGGPMYYLRDGLNSRFLSGIFTLFCMGACFGMGNMVQANAIAASLEEQFHIGNALSGIILLIVVASVTLGGCKKIGKINSSLVPIMSCIYILCCLIIISIRIRMIPTVILTVMKEAFSLPAALGGVSSFGILLAIKNGFSKGIFSSEAGLGSAPIAHASADSNNEVEHGMWGMFEVFFTMIICTMTSLVILSSNSFNFEEAAPNTLTLFAFESSLPFLGGICVCLSTVLFSLSTILGWAFYGEVCIDFLLNGNLFAKVVFRICYILAVFIGSVSKMQRVWLFSELMNGFMAIPNLIGVLFLSKKAIFEAKQYFEEKSSKQ